ncbi:MAG: hypothetical protein JW922_01855 [Paludibacteraceae bacterium]|nr:hypothetical protein [Paludibacteraceae bacterium]
MKKLLGFLLISILLLVLRYTIALFIVNNQVINPAVSIDKKALLLPSEVMKNTKELTPQFRVNLVSIMPMLSSYAVNIPFTIDNTESGYILKMFLASFFLSITIMYLKSILELLWIFEDREYFVYVTLLFYPSAFIYSFDPLRSAFLMFTVLSFFYLFKKKYKKAALYVGISAVLNCLGLILLIPFFYYLVMNERNDPKFKLVPKLAKLLTLAFLPSLIYGIYLFMRTGALSFFGLAALEETKKFMFIPLGYFFDYYQQYGLTINFVEITQASFLLLFIVIFVVEFIKLFLMFEYKTNEQNALFIYTAIFTLLYSSSTVGNDIVQGLGLCISSFILPAIVLNIPLRGLKFMSIVLLFVSLQTMMFVGFLIS